MKKNKVFKIVFFISLIPFIIIVLISLYHAIFGYDVYTWIIPTYVKTVYGFEAFLESLIWLGLTLIYIPVLPICLIIQIIYLINYIIRKIKDRK
ncbi:MAG: hypothetical protein J6C46_01475 [Clostridia bacterium]|nr:hypothetical protein [Clostridia bacterium]